MTARSLKSINSSNNRGVRNSQVDSALDHQSEGQGSNHQYDRDTASHIQLGNDDTQDVGRIFPVFRTDQLSGTARKNFGFFIPWGFPLTSGVFLSIFRQERISFQGGLYLKTHAWIRPWINGVEVGEGWLTLYQQQKTRLTIFLSKEWLARLTWIEKVAYAVNHRRI